MMICSQDYARDGGRSVWFETSPHHSLSTPFQSTENGVLLIGIAGGSASGKTSVAELIIKQLKSTFEYPPLLISLDSFYKALTLEEKEIAFRNEYDFDIPDAFDWHLLIDALIKLRNGEAVIIPHYCFKTHSRLESCDIVYGHRVIIFEGIYALHNPTVMSLMDLKIFVDTDSDLRLSRRLTRDISERNRDLSGQYEKFVKPAYEKFIHPTIKNADIIIPRGKENTIAIEIVSKYIDQHVESKPQFQSSLRVSLDKTIKTDDKAIIYLYCSCDSQWKTTKSDSHLFMSLSCDMSKLFEFKIPFCNNDCPLAVLQRGAKSNCLKFPVLIASKLIKEFGFGLSE